MSIGRITTIKYSTLSAVRLSRMSTNTAVNTIQTSRAWKICGSTRISAGWWKPGVKFPVSECDQETSDPIPNHRYLGSCKNTLEYTPGSPEIVINGESKVKLYYSYKNLTTSDDT